MSLLPAGVKYGIAVMFFIVTAILLILALNAFTYGRGTDEAFLAVIAFIIGLVAFITAHNHVVHHRDSYATKQPIKCPGCGLHQVVFHRMTAMTWLDDSEILCTWCYNKRSADSASKDMPDEKEKGV